MTREQAIELLNQHIKNPNLIKHCLAAEALMKGLARKFGEPEEKWGLAGLLHDLDWELTKDNPDEHSFKTFEILKKTDVDPEVAEAIRKHNHVHGLEPETLLEKALYSAEEITGLVTACALVQPDKKLGNVDRESVLKKFKAKSFAAGVNREIIMLVEPWLKIKLEDLVDICLGEMKKISAELGL